MNWKIPFSSSSIIFEFNVAICNSLTGILRSEIVSLLSQEALSESCAEETRCLIKTVKDWFVVDLQPWGHLKTS